MKHKTQKILMIFLFIFLAGFLSNCATKLEQISIDNGKKIINVNVEIADDDYERQQGLMLRERLDENDGMLFVFENEDYRSFWMKNTLIPLDIIFIGENLQIVDIKNAVPCKQDSCSLYTSAKPARYVLEVNAGFAAKNSIEAGNKLDLGNILK